MKLPFVTRSHHDEVVALLTARLGELEQERRLYLDRLATAGLGGPFFAPSLEPKNEPAEPAASPSDEVSEEDILRAYRTRPSHMAAAVTRMFRKRAVRNQMREARGAHIRQAVEDDLNRAEAAGREQASK